MIKKVKNKMMGILLLAASMLVISCGSFRTDGIVGDIIDFGSTAAVAAYPQYANEIQMISNIIRNNQGMGDKEIKKLLSEQIEQRIADPNLQSILNRLVDRAIEKVSGKKQKQNLEELSDALDTECERCFTGK